MKHVDQKTIRELLEYSPESGIFIWRKARGRCSVGTVAGFDTSNGYRAVRVIGEILYLHRAAYLYMTGSIPSEVDHINGVRSDNKWSNLRASNRADNSKNMQVPRSNTSGVIGVFWNSGKRKWTAKIKVHQKNIHIGHFDRLEDAALARKMAEIRFGFYKNHGRKAVPRGVNLELRAAA